MSWRQGSRIAGDRGRVNFPDLFAHYPLRAAVAYETGAIFASVLTTRAAPIALEFAETGEPAGGGP